MNVATQQVDIYSHERAGLMERLCVLAGVTTYREPVGSFTAPTGKMPTAHVLAAALAFARNHSGKARDIGPDVLEALVLGHMTDNAQHITNKLAAALLDVSARMHRLDRRLLAEACRRVAKACAEGVPAERLNGIPAPDWRFIDTFGTRTLWASAEQTLCEVSRVLRSDGVL